MSTLEIDWRGKELTAEVRKVVSDALWESAQNIASGAQNAASSFSDTGAYRDSIRAEKGKAQGSNLTGRPVPSFVKTGSSDPRRPGSIIETGSAHTPAHKTVWPAYDREKPALQQRLTDVI